MPLITARSLRYASFFFGESILLLSLSRRLCDRHGRRLSVGPAINSTATRLARYFGRECAVCMLRWRLRSLVGRISGRHGTYVWARSGTSWGGSTGGGSELQAVRWVHRPLLRAEALFTVIELACVTARNTVVLSRTSMGSVLYWHLILCHCSFDAL